MPPEFARNHNTALQRNASEILETNSMDPMILGVSRNIQPIVLINPSIDTVKCRSTATGGSITLFTTPTDKDFFLTNVHVSAVGDTVTPAAGTASLVITLKDGSQETFNTQGDDNGSTSPPIEMNFGQRGILLAKGAAITCSISFEGFIAIAGYKGSDRS